MTKFTIPNSSVVVDTDSWYSNWVVASKMENCKQIFLFAMGSEALFTPGIASPAGLYIIA